MKSLTPLPLALLTAPAEIPFFRRHWLLGILRLGLAFIYLLIGLLIIVSAFSSALISVYGYFSLAMNASMGTGLSFAASLVGGYLGVKALVRCASGMDQVVQRYTLSRQEFSVFMAYTALSLICTIGSGLWFWRQW